MGILIAPFVLAAIVVVILERTAPQAARSVQRVIERIVMVVCALIALSIFILVGVDGRSLNGALVFGGIPAVSFWGVLWIGRWVAAAVPKPSVSAADITTTTTPRDAHVTEAADNDGKPLSTGH
jgi:hypothetical protein